MSAEILPFDEIVRIAESDDTMVKPMMKAVEEARTELDKRYESLMTKFNSLIKETDEKYDNYDEVCELGDKINNGFIILEEQQEDYVIDPKTHIRLICGVLKEVQNGLDYFDEVCKMYGEKEDQALAAEYEVLTFYRWHFSEVYCEFKRAWLRAYINKGE